MSTLYTPNPEIDDGVPGNAEVTVMEGSAEFNTVSVDEVAVVVDEFKLKEPILLDEGDFRNRVPAGCGGDFRSLDVCNEKMNTVIIISIDIVSRL